MHEESDILVLADWFRRKPPPRKVPILELLLLPTAQSRLRHRLLQCITHRLVSLLVPSKRQPQTQHQLLHQLHSLQWIQILQPQVDSRVWLTMWVIYKAMKWYKALMKLCRPMDTVWNLLASIPTMSWRISISIHSFIPTMSAILAWILHSTAMLLMQVFRERPGI